ncbi:MAG: hypothetical protein J2O49_02540 [Sciscionella sp.]|nr:hypothetical protein [Sciscionella sp.]
MTSPEHSGLTLQVQVADMAKGIAFYTTLFGREPDFLPHKDFAEWRVLTGVELWWQVVEVPGEVRPLTTRVRFRVADIDAARGWLRAELGVPSAPVTTLPGVVRFTDFADPWGNRLGYYEDVVPSDQQPEPGGSVHDDAMFTVENES